jgi:hypothetical protein
VLFGLLYTPRTHLWALAAAGLIGFAGNEIAAQVRLRGGRRLLGPALIADGKHARADGYVSLAVVITAIAVAAGFERADPIIGLLITLVILKITWDSWRVISTTEPGEPHSHDHLEGSARCPAATHSGQKTWPFRSPFGGGGAITLDRYGHLLPGNEHQAATRPRPTRRLNSTSGLLADGSPRSAKMPCRRAARV